MEGGRLEESTAPALTPTPPGARIRASNRVQIIKERGCALAWRENGHAGAQPLRTYLFVHYLGAVVKRGNLAGDLPRRHEVGKDEKQTGGEER